MTEITRRNLLLGAGMLLASPGSGLLAAETRPPVAVEPGQEWVRTARVSQCITQSNPEGNPL
jgi:hypothetical protein